MGYQVLFVGTGLLIVLLSIPLAQRRVPPNRWYGLRLWATSADEQVWYEANAASGRDSVIFGAVFTLLALLLPLVPGMTEAAYSIVGVGFLLVGSVIVSVRGVRLANRLIRERREKLP
jgi:hypothetical protein